MGRFIIVAAAALLGVLIALLVMPAIGPVEVTVSPVAVNPDLPVFQRTDTLESEFPKAGLPTMSEDRRRNRAAELVNEPLQYVRAGRLLHPTSIKQRGIEALERMMDECYMLTDQALFARHLKAVAMMDPSEVDPEPDHVTKSQLRSCNNVAEVYAETRK